MPNRCKVCAHKDVKKINAELVKGAKLEALTKAYGLDKSTLHRHKKTHIPAQLAKAQEAREVASAGSLMERIAELDKKSNDTYKRAIKTKSLSTAVSAIGEMRRIAELYAKVTGELQAQTTINNNVNNNVVIMPEWVKLRDGILRVLGPYPEARQAVIEAIRGLEP